MRHYESTALIEAHPSAIWAILTDAPAYSTWDSSVVKLEGRIEQGEKLKVTSEANPKRAFPVKVTELRPGERMTWTGGMPLSLFKGERVFRTQPEDGAVRFTMREEYTGPLAPLMFRSIPDMQRSFDKFARNLKQRAERGS